MIKKRLNNMSLNIYNHMFNESINEDKEIPNPLQNKYNVSIVILIFPASTRQIYVLSITINLANFS